MVFSGGVEQTTKPWRQSDATFIRYAGALRTEGDLIVSRRMKKAAITPMQWLRRTIGID
jgi:hypothetical protein